VEPWASPPYISPTPSNPRVRSVAATADRWHHAERDLRVPRTCRNIRRLRSTFYRIAPTVQGPCSKPKN